MTSKQNIFDYESKEEFFFHNEPNEQDEIILLSSLSGQVLTFILKIGKFLIYVITCIVVVCTFSCVYFFYLLPSCGNRISPSPVFMTISMSMSNHSNFVAAQAPKIVNSVPSSHPQHTSIVPFSTSQGVFSASRGILHLTSSSHGSMLWVEEPKSLKERVIWKEHLPFDPPCLPVLPKRR